MRLPCQANGWREGLAGAEATVFNHNVYITSYCGPAVVRDNIFSRASATGVQARSGGTVENNLFARNPIAMTYGLVYGGSDPVHSGVTGRIWLDFSCPVSGRAWSARQTLVPMHAAGGGAHNAPAEARTPGSAEARDNASRKKAEAFAGS